MNFQPFSPSLRIGKIAAALALNAALSVSAAQAQGALPKQPQADSSIDRGHIEEVLSGLSRGRSIEEAAISPDGLRLAWIEKTNEGVEIRVEPVDDLIHGLPAKSQRVTAAAKPETHCEEGKIAWAPEAKSLIFVSDCDRLGQPEIYLTQLDGSPLKRLTELKGYVEAPAFSPDGKRVAFLYVEGATRPAGALAAMKPPAGVIGEEGLEIQRVAVAEVEWTKPQAPVMASPANLHVYEFDWRPDSKGLAYVAANPPGENDWWVAKLYTQVLGGKPEIIFSPAVDRGALHGLQIAVPRWSPDGKSIAFIGGLMSDQGSTGGDVWILPATEDSKQPTLSFQRASTASWLEWKDASSLYVSSLAGGNARLELLDFQAKSKAANSIASFGAPLYDLPATIGDGRLEMGVSATRDHSLFAFVASSFDNPPEIYLARAAEKKREEIVFR